MVFGAKPLRLSNISDSRVAYLLYRLLEGQFSSYFQGKHLPLPLRSSPHTLLLLCPDSRLVDSISDDLQSLLGDFQDPNAPKILRFPRWDMLPFDALSPAPEISSQRLWTLSSVQQGDPAIVVAAVDACMQMVPSRKSLNSASFCLKCGEQIEREQLLLKLAVGGYQRATVVEERGQIAVRGMVVDIFPPGLRHPLRIEFSGECIESLRLFDTSTQRSLCEIEKHVVVPVREFFLPVDVGQRERFKYRALQRLRERSAALGIASAVYADAFAQDDYWAGIEHCLPIFTEDVECPLDYFDLEKTAVCLYEEAAIQANVEHFEGLLEERAVRAAADQRVYPEVAESFVSAERISTYISDTACCYFDQMELLDLSEEKEALQFRAADLSLHDNSGLRAALERSRHRELPFAPLAERVAKAVEAGGRVVFVVHSPQRERRISNVLEAYDISLGATRTSLKQVEQEDWSSGAYCVRGGLQRGFVDGKANLQLIAESDIFPETASRRQISATNARRIIGAMAQFSEGDYVVHMDHGIALYRGLRHLQIRGDEGDFLELEFAKDAKLLIPIEQIANVQKYIGAEGTQPALSRLGGSAWSKTRAKVKEKVTALAGQLLSLYAHREVANGISFGEPDEEDQAFADEFPFEETPDQDKAIQDVLTDLASYRPMDRLVCGDVGYGKTEVAMRAAFKVVNARRQAAILAPTTVLADQHFASFTRRFADWPITVGCVSRFNTPQQNKETLGKLASGGIDIIIGTHRLLQRDVKFKNLGLLVVDEEHRFGVAQKEKLKQFKHEIDVLTLTATPIPRTLHMSLINIRDLSVIETPPCDRQVTRTYIAPYVEETVREAILRELERGGQTFFINNRVQNIELVTAQLRELIPEARIEFAHGQMKDSELETIMHSFVGGTIDVLVSTTIVESGLDIPNANTIIIKDADRLGLAELYQLRGRVGRSSRRAYAYLLVNDPKSMRGVAKKRLQVLQSLDDLGVGFRLAMQDMEIRGAGNLLGKDQSGQVNLIGYELYTKIMRDAIAELRSREDQIDAERLPEFEPEVKLGVSAFIPEDYIPDVAERLLLYQRVVELRSDNQAYDLLEEMGDRFGTPPQPVEQLVELMLARAILKRRFIAAISRGETSVALNFHPEAPIDPTKVLTMIKENPRVSVSPSMRLKIKLDDDTRFSSPLRLCRYVESIVAGVQPDALNN